jgi:hypothetical protein
LISRGEHEDDSLVLSQLKVDKYGKLMLSADQTLRFECLKLASMVLSGTGASAAGVTYKAEEFEKYIRGD